MVAVAKEASHNFDGALIVTEMFAVAKEASRNLDGALILTSHASLVADAADLHSYCGCGSMLPRQLRQQLAEACHHNK